MANLNLKGLWIPIEILTDKNLSDKEKTIFKMDPMSSTLKKKSVDKI